MAYTSFDGSAVSWACPSEHDLNGGVSGQGRVLQELTFGRLLKGACELGNRVISGFALPSSGSATGRALSGVAVIDGRHIGTVSPHIVVNFPYANTFAFLRLVYDGTGRANGLAIECHDTWANVANSILLGMVTTSGGNITGSSGGQPAGRLIWGNVLLSASTPYCRINNTGSNDWTPSKSGDDLVITFRDSIFVAKSLILIPDSYERSTITVTLTTNTLTIVNAFLGTVDRTFAVVA